MTTFFLVAFVVLAAVNVIVCGWVLLRPGALGLPRLAVVAGLLLLANGLEVVALLPFGLSWFGLAQIAWLDLALVVPACALALLATRCRGRAASPAATVVALAGLAMIPIAFQAWFVTPQDLRLERVTVPLDGRHGADRPLRVAVLADLQATSIGEHERAAVRRLMAEEPDLILLPGDLYQGPVQDFEQHLPAFRSLLRRLHAPGGVWAVTGNAEDPGRLPRLLAGSQVQLLEDELVRFHVGGRDVALLGLSDRASLARQGWPSAPALLERFARRPAGDEIRLLLVHRPGWVLTLPRDSTIDLVVAGHTHGGQLALPWIGPPLVLSRLSNTVGAGGLHRVNGQRLYVSRGVGLERLQAPRIRFGVPPEVTLLTLTGPAPGSDAGP